MRLYTMADGKIVALDSLIELGNVQRSNDNYYYDAVCMGKFALTEKPIQLTMAKFDWGYNLTPSKENRKKESMMRKAEKERIKLVKAWEQTEFQS